MLTIAWDIDDVLNDLMYYWLTDKWLPEHPDCKIHFEQIIENTPEKIINSSKDEYQQSLDSFRLSKDYKKMVPNKEIMAWFEKHGKNARHIALTGVPIKAAHVSAEWVIKYFGNWIRSFSFVPSSRNYEQIPLYDATKADYLKWLNKIDVLVEDSEQNICEAHKLGIKGILIDRPWNKSNIKVKEALEILNKTIKDN